MDMKHTSSSTTAASCMFKTLRQDLISGRFAAGEKISISALKEHYQVGLSPLREALNRLAAYGLLIQENQRGFRVPKLSHNELDDITDMRCKLEGMALERAISNGDAEWESQLVAAAYRLNRVEHGQVETSEWEAVHVHFHRTLVAPCGSEWLTRFIEQLHDQFDRYRRLAPPIPESRTILDAQHNELVELALQRRTIEAQELLTEHIRLSYKIALGSCRDQHD